MYIDRYCIDLKITVSRPSLMNSYMTTLTAAVTVYDKDDDNLLGTIQVHKCYKRITMYFQCTQEVVCDEQASQRSFS